MNRYHNRKRSSFAVGSMLVIGLLLSVSFLGTRCVADIQFNRNCSGYLKQAGDANTIELAKVRLKRAVDYLEEHNMTEGYTSILYTTPAEDVGFWYSNLRKSLDEVNSMKDNATQLEISNVLIKLRETLLDDTGNGVRVTRPRGISIFPYNVVFACWGWLSFLCVGLFGPLFHNRLYD